MKIYLVVEEYNSNKRVCEFIKDFEPHALFEDFESAELWVNIKNNQPKHIGAKYYVKEVEL